MDTTTGIPPAPGTAPHGVPSSTDDAFAGLPPVPLACVSSMALVLASGIYLAAHLPHRAPLGPAVGLVAGGGAVLVVAVVLVARLGSFAWESFLLVAKWALLAYVVIAGILEYVFVYDGTRGSMLVLLTLSLLIFAVDIPILLGFSVARFQAGAAST
ncbi:MAG: hypothetical protein ACRDWE_05690 [Acidimicrobiales bacterium]